MLEPLDYYALIGAALFPIPAGQKHGHLVDSFKHDNSADPEQWAAWRLAWPGCNFGVVAFASQLIIVDIDTSGDNGRDEAWALWCDLCASWGLSGPLNPSVQSASGGWHCYFSVPPHVDASTLRQPDAVKGRINVRCVGYTVAAGSSFEGRPYVLLSDAPPHPAPDALLAHCTPAVRVASTKVGKYDFNEAQKLYQWIADNDAFQGDEEWRTLGMAARVEFGDAGLSLWQILATKGGLSGESLNRWNSFDTEPTADSVTLKSVFDIATRAGWKGNVRVAFGEMFKGVTVDLPGMPAPVSTTPLRDRRIDASSLEGKPVPEAEWLVRDLIPSKNVTLLYGDGGTGKSLLALQLAVAVEKGRPFFGHLTKKGSVEFVTAEDSMDEMHRRLVAIVQSQATTLGALTGLRLTSLVEVDALLATVEDTRSAILVTTALYAELETIIAESRPALVFLDTLADIFGGNEIIRSQARQFIGFLRKLCLKYECTIVVLAHPSLSGMEKGTSGSTGWNNSVRSRLHFGRIHEKDGSELDEDARALRVGKSNYGRVGLEIQMQWRNGAFVATTAGMGGGDPLARSSKADSVFAELLRKARAQNVDVHLSPGKGYAPDYFKSDAAAQGVNKADLVAAMKRLLDGGRIVNEPFGSPSRMRYRLQMAGGA